MNKPGLFEGYLSEGVAKRTSKSIQRASDLISESERKYISLKRMLEDREIDEINAPDLFEFCYDLLIYLLRAKLYLEGYSCSGVEAHEAEVSYMRNLGFVENEVSFMDEVRYNRNGSKYYGKKVDKEYAEKVIDFTEKIYPKLKKIVATNK